MTHMTPTEPDQNPQPPPAAKRKLPLGIQTFREIREGGCYYVDKTDYVRRLVEGGKHYFLSRPRRFGKSLLLDTLKELFEGNEALFEGLDVHDRWDWSVRHPVVRLSFGGGSFRNPDHVHASAMAQLDAVQRQTGAASEYATAPERLAHLLEVLHRQAGRRVVVLVDEYDKPIVDVLDEPAVARANRDFLRGFYGVVKDSDAHVRFTFVTGVSKFSKVSLFSDLNNLTDVTLDERYSGICGYTEADLDETFAPELPGLDRQAIRDWYDGYGWLGAERVYNPCDVLLLFDKRRFGAWWFETGTPAFLIERLFRLGLHFPRLDGLRAGDDLLFAFDVDRMAPEALLFQTGYLTIKGVEEADPRDRTRRRRYRLGYPNWEVREGLTGRLLDAALPRDARELASGVGLRRRLEARDFAGVETLLRAFFDSIPYEWYTNNDIARYEGYYASVFYGYVEGAGLEATVEDSSNRGRLDMAVRSDGDVYLFEFKVVESGPEGAALAQLRERGYAAKYRHLGRPIHLLGIEFSRETRNVVAFDVEQARQA